MKDANQPENTALNRSWLPQKSRTKDADSCSRSKISGAKWTQNQQSTDSSIVITLAQGLTLKNMYHKLKASQTAVIDYHSANSTYYTTVGS
ncbi:MAG: hypothetical protein ABSB71_11755 [Candidatus Bathyarchaeia archaeon]